MATIRVGVRELKARLSAYMREVEAGATVVITDRGRPVGRITPVRSTARTRMEDLAASGLFRWSGKRFAPEEPGIEPRGRRQVADLVLENRE